MKRKLRWSNLPPAPKQVSHQEHKKRVAGPWSVLWDRSVSHVHLILTFVADLLTDAVVMLLALLVTSRVNDYSKDLERGIDPPDEWLIIGLRFLGVVAPLVTMTVRVLFDVVGSVIRMWRHFRKTVLEEQ